MIYFTSDLHLGHRAIIPMCDRPFKDVEEMNNTIIWNINRIVHNDDKLYILGDIAHHISFEERNELLSRIKGRKYLLIGNHDLKGDSGMTDYDPELFEWQKDYHKEAMYGLNIVMMHYPILSWHKMNAGSIMLHGHIHSKLEYNLENIRNGIKRFDVGVDANDFRPVSILTIKEWAKKAEENKKEN